MPGFRGHPGEGAELAGRGPHPAGVEQQPVDQRGRQAVGPGRAHVLVVGDGDLGAAPVQLGGHAAERLVQLPVRGGCQLPGGDPGNPGGGQDRA